MRFRTIALLAGLAFLLAGAFLPVSTRAQESRPAAPPDSAAEARELKSEVPELTAFHEVIFQLWHKAWPDKNVQMIKDLLPQVQHDFQMVAEAKLPGILRDRQAQWDEGLKEMTAAVKAYEAAAAANDQAKLLDAVELLHSRFEAQMRVARPVMKELDAYHVELYQVYHRFLPQKQLNLLRGAVSRMSTRCNELKDAAVPRWYTGDAKVLKEEIAGLCEQTDRLKIMVLKDDWTQIERAVEMVHTQYRKVEGMFR